MMRFDLDYFIIILHQIIFIFSHRYNNLYIMDNTIAYTLVIIVILFIICHVVPYNANDTNNNNKNKKVENFMGGYYYPYDYPYYWPYFYSGCNENVFGDVKCLPFYAHPFW
jgi:hypothetical protein